jgi:hypothetical protein
MACNVATGVRAPERGGDKVANVTDPIGGAIV